MKEDIRILFTVDENYIRHIPPVLKSVQIANQNAHAQICLIAGALSEGSVAGLRDYCEKLGFSFSLFQTPESLFADALVNRHYSKAMYYRLLASEILPDSWDRVLYLDPDVLVINSLLPLWNMQLEGNCFAAASHLEEEGVVDTINKFRLDETNIYFNTGVMLMDLRKSRETINKEEIFSFIDGNNKLLLPDQDVFNALYGGITLPIPDEIWNYDVRRYSRYLIKSAGAMNDEWVMKNTAILHFCGKEKPWDRHYRYRFGNLYKHYENLSRKERCIL